MEKKLSISGLEVRVGNKSLLRGISIDLAREEILVVLGPSGSGKTTLLRAIAGLEKVHGGCIEIDGQVVANHQTSLPPHLRNIGMVFQDLALWPHLKVKEQLKAIAPKGMDMIANLLSLFRLESLQDRYPSQLSGGEQQRLAIARALVHRPRLLLLDEPFSDLDWELREEMMELIRKLRAEWKLAMIFVTHDQLEAECAADRIVIMRNGGIEQSGSLDDLLAAPTNEFVGRFLQPVLRRRNG